MRILHNIKNCITVLFLLPILSLAQTLNITINADDIYDLYINGIFVGSDTSWDRVETYNVIAIEGKNVIALYCKNGGGKKGLIAEIKINDSIVITDTSWLSFGSLIQNWNTVNFDDRLWSKSVDLGKCGTQDYWQNNYPLNSNAHWIWGTENQKEVYFRKIIYNISPEQDTTPPINHINRYFLNGNFTIFWDQNKESDMKYYFLYMGKTINTVAKVKEIIFPDSSVFIDINEYIKLYPVGGIIEVSAVDTANNESEKSIPVYITITKPQKHSFFKKKGEPQ